MYSINLLNLFVPSSLKNGWAEEKLRLLFYRKRHIFFTKFPVGEVASRINSDASELINLAKMYLALLYLDVRKLASMGLSPCNP